MLVKINHSSQLELNKLEAVEKVLTYKAKINHIYINWNNTGSYAEFGTDTDGGFCISSNYLYHDQYEELNSLIIAMKMRNSHA